ncbi:GNAT family N-acetyltransferase [Actinoplanes siamensis]|uniref:N-acetyltransferase domain-containing protein n=1 Tax=Actinoplanes siamensis TaxID=1223317 RepID=A0A919NFJ8_9ACTN|nr:GNAT family N-acetyltransferase [Actinoplanes siamensis]GIF09755.1 hypothetical protein Asi03nite_72930 [Actinoplanes siamensis]
MISTGAPISGDRSAASLLSLLDLIVATSPGAWARSGRNGDRLISSGATLGTCNGVFPVGPEADPADVAEFAALGHDRPWSVFCRREPSPSLRAAAAAHGLTAAYRSPVLGLGAHPISLPPGGPVVRRISGADRSFYLDALAGAFQAPRELFGGIMSAAVLGAPEISAYVVQDRGVPVATSLGFLVDGLVGVYNVATVPAARRRGYGRLATRVVLRDAFAAGADGAYLVSSEEGLPLYASMGFQHIEDWVYLTAES